MFYTFSRSEYDLQQLEELVAQITEQDAILLWQNGVLLPLKYPMLFQDTHYYVLENDVIARHLQHYFSPENTAFSLISLTDFVKLTEEYFPQISL
ncbi:DsrH/TusB family sulfur relay protein [Gallibacterium trehalosifermentans]|uniref:DsrH/TusB family sulfur relay protein n=1 Tax=Gallibacterium trehalosifermentans TaxID=516935 RepID=A0ABV6GZW8_9PAST